jgi:hypothetical protein
MFGERVEGGDRLAPRVIVPIGANIRAPHPISEATPPSRRQGSRSDRRRRLGLDGEHGDGTRQRLSREPGDDIKSFSSGAALAPNRPSQIETELNSRRGHAKNAVSRAPSFGAADIEITLRLWISVLTVIDRVKPHLETRPAALLAAGRRA